jgi:PAS domain S-box-containing protein
MLYMFELHRSRGGFLRYTSARGPALFGLPPVDAQHDMDTIWSLIAEEDRQRMYAAFLSSARTLCDWTSDFRIRRPDGEWRHMAAHSTPERIDAEVTRWYGYIEDVTERVQLEQARRDAALAGAANRAKTEFLSRMSHELRTPLNAVLGFTQLMEIDHADPPSAGQLRRLKLIREAGEHLLSMIGDLLDLTRIESGGMALVLEPVALHELAAQSMEMMRSAALAAQVSLRLAEGGETLLVQADRTRLRQVLLNLLSNAVKYNRPTGSVTVQVQAGADGQVQLAVSDTGVGIAEADPPVIFEPFQRGPHARSTVEGAGIGLSVTQALVGLMRGQVAVDSELGVGSRFTVSLPRVGGSGPQSAT